MKYRIKEENDGFNTYYYPQYKWLLFWHCFSPDGRIEVYFFTLEEAKGWLKKKMAKPTIRIHKIK